MDRGMIFAQNKDNQLTLLKEILMRAVPKLVLMLIAFNVLLYANPDKLHGKWNIESIIHDGEVQKLSPKIPAFMEFNKDTMTYTMGRLGKVETSGTHGEVVLTATDISTGQPYLFLIQSQILQWASRLKQ